MPVRRRARPLLLAAVALTVPGLGSRPASAQEACCYDFSNVSAMVENAVASVPLDGASLILVVDGQVVYVRAFGDYTLARAVPLGSATTWYAATTIAALVDDGKLNWDDPVSRYLPQWTGRKGTITVRQLLAHTSGLPGDHPCLAVPSITLADCVDQISRVDLLADPGREFHFGAASFQVAGRVAEVAGGLSWAALFEEKVRHPLQLTDTAYGATQNPRIATGLRSTLLDYASLLRMHAGQGLFGPSRVLQPVTVREMQRDATRGAPLVDSPYPDGRRYGLGVWRDADGAAGDAAQLSDQGESGVSPWLDRPRRLVGVFLADGRLADVGGLVAGIQQEVRRVLDGTTCDAAGRSRCAADQDLDGVPDVADDCPLAPDPGQADTDGDARGDLCDCAPFDARAWEPPGEVTGLRVRGDKATILWDIPADPGASVETLRYDLLRSGDPRDFLDGATCVASGVGPYPVTADLATPGAGRALFYLVRAHNPCAAGAGPLAHDPLGWEIAARRCP